jgi:hypothetical protein
MMNDSRKKHFKKYKHYDFFSGGLGEYLTMENFIVEEQVVDAHPIDGYGMKYRPHNDAFIEFLQCDGNGAGFVLSKDKKTFSCHIPARWDKAKNCWSATILLIIPR